ncbi:hypothetical protein PIB30_069771 [Stylosanthes scabra]|uniref:Uncharacterized protein n=1 Tax=Stylosanthes scabra TaxID=79078 RepID=A0ABU6YQ57_9FABA|nr:hypothetical protein [Stylosanthes scabra]
MMPIQKLFRQAKCGTSPLLYHPRKWKSECFNSIFVTTGPSSGGVDDLKILDMLNRVFTRSAMEFGKKIYQTRLEFEVGIEFGKSGGLVVKRSARTANLFENMSLTHGEALQVQLGAWVVLLGLKFIQFQDQTTTSQGLNAISAFE